MPEEDKLSAIDRRPWVMPLLGGMAGLCLWVVDVFIDIYLLDEDQTFLENLLQPEFTELWMRLLVVIVMVLMGVVARQSIRRHLQVERLRQDYQHRLENLVADRTLELEKKTRQLQELANRDSLTNLYNRRCLLGFLQQEMERSKRFSRGFSVLYIDADHFKSINDRFGHDVGDAVLIELAERIRSNIRSVDASARWGGEEFVVLAPDTDAIQAGMLAEKILAVVRSAPFTDVGSLSVSIGLAVYQRGESIDDLLRRADQALYQAKEAGRDRLVKSTH